MERNKQSAYSQPNDEKSFSCQQTYYSLSCVLHVFTILLKSNEFTSILLYIGIISCSQNKKKVSS